MNESQDNDETINLGAKTTRCLNEIGIYTRCDLEQISPVKAFVKMKHECVSMKPSLNLLYALVGYLEDRHWAEVAKQDKDRLVREVNVEMKLQEILKANE
ncbi:MAG: competence-specific regulator [Blastopirellula sp.]|nr:MAG: competence-specific regulator [Blastopirellula sp.]